MVVQPRNIFLHQITLLNFLLFWLRILIQIRAANIPAWKLELIRIGRDGTLGDRVGHPRRSWSVAEDVLLTLVLHVSWGKALVNRTTLSRRTTIFGKNTRKTLFKLLINFWCLLILIHNRTLISDQLLSNLVRFWRFLSDRFLILIISCLFNLRF